MLNQLGPNGMAAPESDDEGDALIKPVYYWISPDVTSLLNEIDRLDAYVKASRLKDPSSPPGKRRGNKPRPIKELSQPWYKTDSPPTTGLPKNWYRRDWYSGCTKVRKMDLKVTDDVPLPSVVRILRLFSSI